MMKRLTMGLLSLTLASTVWSQEIHEKNGRLIVLPSLKQVTVQGLYGENNLVRAAGNPTLGLTYSNFSSGEIHVGDLDQAEREFTSLHLPSFGWFIDGLTGSRGGARLTCVGVGASVRLTSNPLNGEQSANNRWYYGSGIGLYATRVEAARNSTGAGLGLRLFGGKDFRDGSVIEVAYSYRPGTQGVHPSGLSLGIGRRF